jgi:S-adenosylmethionine:tRNA ribosyltransferase-isomerase
MVIDRSDYRIDHSVFYNIEKFLAPGDLMVFNTSRTLPASLEGYDKSGGPLVEVRLAEYLPDDSWLALLRCRQAVDPFSCGIHKGMQIKFDLGLVATVYEHGNYFFI